MLIRKIIANQKALLQSQQKLLEQAFIKALRPQALIVSAQKIQSFSEMYQYPLNKIRKFLRQESSEAYSWKTIIVRPAQIAETCPDMPPGLRAELQVLLKKYRNPRRTLPFPHLVWHKQPSWVKPISRFPTLGITCLVRPLVTFHQERAERRHNLRVDAGTLGIVFHIGQTKDESMIRLVSGTRLVHTRLFDTVFAIVDALRPDLMQLFFQGQYEDLAQCLFKKINEAIAGLGDTSFRLDW